MLHDTYHFVLVSHFIWWIGRIDNSSFCPHPSNCSIVANLNMRAKDLHCRLVLIPAHGILIPINPSSLLQLLDHLLNKMKWEHLFPTWIKKELIKVMLIWLKWSSMFRASNLGKLVLLMLKSLHLDDVHQMEISSL
jgi:hypothetical protein